MRHQKSFSNPLIQTHYGTAQFSYPPRHHRECPHPEHRRHRDGTLQRRYRPRLQEPQRRSGHRDHLALGHRLQERPDAGLHHPRQRRRRRGQGSPPQQPLHRLQRCGKDRHRDPRISGQRHRRDASVTRRGAGSPLPLAFLRRPGQLRGGSLFLDRARNVPGSHG